MIMKNKEEILEKIVSELEKINKNFEIMINDFKKNSLENIKKECDETLNLLK